MTTSKAQELAQLRDIHLPDPIGWWPLAPGWYLLLILTLLATATIIFIVMRYYRNGACKRQALRLITEYQQEYSKHNNPQLSASRLSELLKRVALVYFPRKKVAGLQGKAWVEFLNVTSKGLDFKQVNKELLEMPYQPGIKGDLPLLFSMSRSWIKQRRGRCLN